MQITPYLTFNGQCADAFAFYQRVLGGELAIQTHGESPIADQVPAEHASLVLHARLDAGTAVLMGSDAPPDQPQQHGGFSVAVQVDDPAEADRVFQELAESGMVIMPIEKTFWAERFGMAVDQFGVPWMVNCEAAAS